MSFHLAMAEALEAGVTNQFLLTGNVSDLLPADGGEFLPLDAVLAKRFGDGRIVIRYDLAGGVTVAKEHRMALVAAYGAATVTPDQMLQGQAANPNAARQWSELEAESGVYSVLTLRRLREFLVALSRKPAERAVALVVESADMLFPEQSTGSMSDVDRQRIMQLTGLLADPAFCESRNMLVLVSRASADISERIRSHPRLMHVEIGRPAPDVRQAWLRKLGAEPTPSLVTATGGMTLASLRTIVRESRHKGRELHRRELIGHLNRLLRSELGENIEIVTPGHTMADVVGNTRLKAVLDRVARLIRHDDGDICPVGILASGPNGVGKTFIFEAWASSLDMTVVSLKNLRSMYFGQTDRIFEVLKSVLQTLGNVVILVDEADVAFARPGPDTHETEARLFGHVIQMMGDKRNRGRIVWVLMTARPHLLAPDIKRPGRCGLHIPVFDPEGEDLDAYLRFAFGKMLDELGIERLKQVTAGFSASDFNELRLLLKGERAIDPSCTTARLTEIAESYRPADIAREREFQIAEAMKHCSFRELLPGRQGAA